MCVKTGEIQMRSSLIKVLFHSQFPGFDNWRTVKVLSLREAGWMVWELSVTNYAISPLSLQLLKNKKGLKFPIIATNIVSIFTTFRPFAQYYPCTISFDLPNSPLWCVLFSPFHWWGVITNIIHMVKSKKSRIWTPLTRLQNLCV